MRSPSLQTKIQEPRLVHEPRAETPGDIVQMWKLRTTPWGLLPKMQGIRGIQVTQEVVQTLFEGTTPETSASATQQPCLSADSRAGQEGRSHWIHRPSCLAALLPAWPQLGSFPGPCSQPHTHLTTLVLTFGTSVWAPLCQNAFPHRGPCIPAHSLRTCLPPKRAGSILNPCNCLPSVSSGGLVVYERRIEPKVETRKVKVEVPPFAPEPWDSPGILPAATVRNCSGINASFTSQTRCSLCSGGTTSARPRTLKSILGHRGWGMVTTATSSAPCLLNHPVQVAHLCELQMASAMTRHLLIVPRSAYGIVKVCL